MEEELRRVLQVHSLPCGAVITAGGAAVARVGDFEALGSAGLVSALLGPEGSPAATLARLDDQALPELWEDDGAFAVVDKLAPEVAVVVFGRGRGGWVERMRLAQAVGRAIREAFGEGRPNKPLQQTGPA